MILDQPPTKENLVLFDKMKDNAKTSRSWEYWFNSLFRSVSTHQFLSNNHLVLNPDYHWSRTIGNNPTTSDGEFVEKWNVASNGMTFAITPTDYISTEFSSLSGSQRYINIHISNPNSNEFKIFQDMPGMLSVLQNRQISISAGLKNNLEMPVKGVFSLDFDITGDGIFEYTVSSKTFQIESGFKNLFIRLESPKITTDNLSNKVRVNLKLININNEVNVDSFFTKIELSDDPTPLRVNHTLEKLLIDNA